MKKTLIVVSILFALALSLSALPALALDPGLNAIENTIDLGGGDPREMAANIINVAMGFLGIVAVVIILLGGFKWMTAGGNEDKVGEAKKLIGAGVIGLVIILASWSIAQFVINQLLEATNAA